MQQDNTIGLWRAILQICDAKNTGVYVVQWVNPPGMSDVR